MLWVLIRIASASLSHNYYQIPSLSVPLMWFPSEILRFAALMRLTQLKMIEIILKGSKNQIQKKKGLAVNT